MDGYGRKEFEKWWVLREECNVKRHEERQQPVQDQSLMMKSWIMMMHQTLPLLKAWTTQLGTLWRSGRHVFWCQQAVASRIRFKLCLLMHLIHTGRALQHLVNSVQSGMSFDRRQTICECMYLVTLIYAIFCSCDLYLDQITFTYQLDLVILMMHLHANNEVSRSRFSRVTAQTGQTDRQTHRHTHTHKTEHIASSICRWNKSSSN